MVQQRYLKDALMLLLVFLSACESSPSDKAFEQTVEPILTQHCVMCHMAGGAQGELNLFPEPYANLVEVISSQSKLLLVDPGNVEASYLFHKLVGSHLKVGGEGVSMPYQRDSLAT
ncbi:MAG: hypothetical protein ACJ04P_14980, partial [Halioglobus sp.]